MAVVALYLKRSLQLGRHWKHYLTLGTLNSGLSFMLLAYSSKILTASVMSVVIATASIFASAIDAIWSRQLLPLKQLTGLVLGILGVGILVGFDPISLEPGAGLAILAALGAACCYGIATVYTRHSKTQLEPFQNAHGNIWGAVVFILPWCLFFPMPEVPNADAIFSVLMIGILCTGVAYILYFKLIKDIGPAPALTVTFLVPGFGILWGHLFLSEVIGWHTVIGAVIAVSGTALVTGFSIKTLRVRKVLNNA